MTPILPIVIVLKDYNCCTLIRISIKLVTINNIPALIQPLSESLMVQFTDAYKK